MEEITIRIKKLLDIQNLNPSQLADQIGINRSRLSHILTGRNNPSLEIIQGILTQYPDINPDWLISGSGEIYRDIITPSQKGDIESEVESLSNDLFSYAKPVQKQILKSQPLESVKKTTQVIDNENKIIENKVSQEAREKVTESINNTKSRRVGIKMITVLYENNEYEILYPEK